MIIEEGTVINLDNGAQYYLAHEIGELEGYEGTKYYFSVGVTKDEKINIKDIIFLEVTQENDIYTATKVEEGTELHTLLNCLEVTKLLIDTIPGYQDRLIESIEKFDLLEESSN